MIKWLCRCGFEYLECKEQPKFEKLSARWLCPSCGKSKAFFMRIEYTSEAEEAKVPIIKAEYDSRKQWRMDPRQCYFTIRSLNNMIKVKYYVIENGKHKLELVIEGKNGEEIYNTIIRENLLSSLTHAAYLGYELAKAEIAMKSGLEYVQDEPLRRNVRVRF